MQIPMLPTTSKEIVEAVNSAPAKLFADKRHRPYALNNPVEKFTLYLSSRADQVIFEPVIPLLMVDDEACRWYNEMVEQATVRRTVLFHGKEHVDADVMWTTSPTVVAVCREVYAMFNAEPRTDILTLVAAYYGATPDSLFSNSAFLVAVDDSPQQSFCDKCGDEGPRAEPDFTGPCNKCSGTYTGLEQLILSLV